MQYTQTIPRTPQYTNYLDSTITETHHRVLRARTCKRLGAQEKIPSIPGLLKRLQIGAQAIHSLPDPRLAKYSRTIHEDQ
jgi:hypothetical protein